jgi:hypothetical protein
MDLMHNLISTLPPPSASIHHELLAPVDDVMLLTHTIRTRYCKRVPVTTHECRFCRTVYVPYVAQLTGGQNKPGVGDGAAAVTAHLVTGLPSWTALLTVLEHLVRGPEPDLGTATPHGCSSLLWAREHGDALVAAVSVAAFGISQVWSSPVPPCYHRTARAGGVKEKRKQRQGGWSTAGR